MPKFNTINDLETPSILIDLDIMEANISRIQQRCNQLTLRLRPHTKTHKIPALAKIQLETGAQGIACQKVSEAEVFADAGFDDIQLPYNIVGKRKTQRLAQLAKRCQISVTVDSIAVVDGIVSALRENEARLAMLIELVTEGKRTGIHSDDAITLAQHILKHEDCVDFAGIMAYPSTAQTSIMLHESLEKFTEAEIDVPMVSGGGSGALEDENAVTELDEVRMGTYIFYDWRSVNRGWATIDNCAMRVRASVVSANEPDRVILDSGSKTLTSETIDDRHGYILESPEARIYKLNEEHAYVDFTGLDMPKVGDILHIVPVHTCTVTNLHNQIYGIRGENIEATYDVATRGLVW